jgi:hypothetical protein
LYGEHTKKSAPSALMSTNACGVRCTPSTYTSVPVSCAVAAMVATSGRLPSRFDAAVSATTRVLGVSTRATSAGVRTPVAGSKSAQWTVAPTAVAACTHGRTFASWSRRVTTTSSPGPQPFARVRAKS